MPEDAAYHGYAVGTTSVRRSRRDPLPDEILGWKEVYLLPNNGRNRSDPACRGRTKRASLQAHKASALNDPHICAIYDIGSQGDIVYLVMEYVEGETLAARLSRGPLNVEEAVRPVRNSFSTCKSHRLGIVHRDVKPGNVMLTSPRSAFGLLMGRDHTALSSSSSCVVRLRSGPRALPPKLIHRKDSSAAA